MVDYYIYHNYIYTYIYTYIYSYTKPTTTEATMFGKKHFWRIGGANPQTEFFYVLDFGWFEQIVMF